MPTSLQFPCMPAGYAVVSVLLQQTHATVDCSFIVRTRKFVGMVSCTTLYQVRRTSSSAILLRIDPQSTARLCSLILIFAGGPPTVMCSQRAMRLQPRHSPATVYLNPTERERERERDVMSDILERYECISNKMQQSSENSILF